MFGTQLDAIIFLLTGAGLVLLAEYIALRVWWASLAPDQLKDRKHKHVEAELPEVRAHGSRSFPPRSIVPTFFAGAAALSLPLSLSLCRRTALLICNGTGSWLYTRQWCFDCQAVVVPVAYPPGFGCSDVRQQLNLLSRFLKVFFFSFRLCVHWYASPSG